MHLDSLVSLVYIKGVLLIVWLWLQPPMFGGQSAPGFGAASSPAPFAFGQQTGAALAAPFSQPAPAFGQATSAPAPTFSSSFGAPGGSGFAAGTSNAAASRRKVNVRRRK